MAENAPRPFRVLFVCLGNICRSPAAEIIFRTLAGRAGLGQAFEVDSCGMISYHEGEKPDRRMLAALGRAGYAWGGHRARAFVRSDFSRFDLIVPQDASNRADIRARARQGDETAHVHCMSRWFAPGEAYDEVPDPYYGGDEGFDAVVALLERSCARLLDELRARLKS